MSRSRIAVEPTECAEGTAGAVTEIGIFLDREDEPDEELRSQLLLLTPAEYESLYQRMITQHTAGIWSMGSVER